MDGLDIAFKLRRKGVRQTDIARALGVAPSTVGNVIHGRITSHMVASHIAGLLGLELRDLWPAKYCYRPRGSGTRKTSAVPTDVKRDTV